MITHRNYLLITEAYVYGQDLGLRGLSSEQAVSQVMPFITNIAETPFEVMLMVISGRMGYDIGMVPLTDGLARLIFAESVDALQEFYLEEGIDESDAGH